MIINTQENFPILGATDFGALLSRNGDITFAYECTFANLNALSSDNYNLINQNFKNAFASLLPNTLLHAQTFFCFNHYGENDISLPASSETFLGSANERLLYEKKFKETKSYLFFTLVNIPPTKKNLSSNDLFNSLLKMDKKNLSREIIDKFQQGVISFLRSLTQGLDFTYQLVPEADLLGSRSRMGICEKYLMLTQDSQNSMKDVLYHKDKNCLKVGDKFVGIFNIDSILSLNDTIANFTADKNLSTEISFFPSALCKPFTHKIDGECIYNVVIYKESTDLIKADLQSLIKQKSGILSFSEENESSLQDTKAFLQNLVDGTGRMSPIRFYANLVFWTAEGYEDYKLLKSQINDGFKKVDLIPFECNEELPIVFMNTMPGNAGNIGSDQMILTYSDVGSAFLNFEETFTFDGKSALGLPLVNRNGARVIVDIFAESGNSRQRKAITGYNFFCLGPTGSGKSVTMNYLVRWAVESGAFVMLVDVGHSYENLCKNYLKGSYFSFGDETPIKINPFMIEGEMPSERRIDMILKILLKAWKGDDEPSKLDENIILQSISYYYNYLSTQKKENLQLSPCFNTYYEYMAGLFKNKELQHLNTSGKFDILHFLDVLKIFYEGGIYGEILNASYDIDLKNERFIVFELDNIKGNKILFPLVVIYMMGTYEEILKEKLNQRKYLIIEEAWKAIMSDMFAQYIKEVYKTARKFKGTIGLITQELDDIISSPIIKETVVTQSDIKIILSMAKYMKKIDKVAQVLSLEDKHVSMLLSLNRDLKPDDKFRELMIQWTNEVYGIYGILLSPKEYWTYTSEAPEKNLVKFLYLREFNRSFETTINYLADLTDKHGGSPQEVIRFCDEKYNYSSKIANNPNIIAYEFE
ncbi:TraG family conjugative transposon ATPase [Arcicella sp. LKC2W]|uniref:TraG family conjugative transposon ATPase n=1 Tax=Arcicella sp. LKC2W TaxID=2984198 RepID=UPI002B20B673|nr:TraG family conjugative transposon ATPase [Arcicella sp. LKC2W]MEA5461633.1 TraG family conjugative transposon ATPase [Arcicella sp. LKC2W]